MSQPTERRKYPRAQAKWAVTLLIANTQIEGVVENFTPKGLFISCDQFPQIEGSFRLVIKIPGRPTMNAAGKVMWSTILDASEGGARLGVGIEFTEISEGDLQYLYETMKEYQDG
ncbi:MAG: PilZ domain-containing protein [Syntrophobacterales bacterium]|jgi:Tfp pilus assembly protein PilZ